MLNVEQLESRQLLSSALTTPVRISAPGALLTDNASSGHGLSVVVWTERSSSAQATLRAQLFDGAGRSVHAPIVVARRVDFQHQPPAVAMDPSGRFVVAWQDGFDIKARRFSAGGTALGPAFAVAASPMHEFEPDVATDARGDFVITYSREHHDPGAVGVDGDGRAKMYRADGQLIRTVTVDQGSGDSLLPENLRVARAPGGSFVVAYQSYDLFPTPSATLRAAFYSADGSLQKRFADLGSGEVDASRRPSVAVALDRRGGAVIVYQQQDAMQAVLVSGAGAAARSVSLQDAGLPDGVGLDPAGNTLTVAWASSPSGSSRALLTITQYSRSGASIRSAVLGTGLFGVSLSSNGSPPDLVSYVNGAVVVAGLVATTG